MKILSRKLLDKKASDLPHFSSVTDNLFSFFKETPPFNLFECIFFQKCNDFSCSDAHLFVFNTFKDEIQIISDAEQKEKLTEPLSQSSSRSKLPSSPYVRLNSRESFYSKGVFIEKGGLVFFRTPDGGLKQWDLKEKLFIDHDTSTLQEANCFAVDSLSQKVYYFTNDSTLCAFNLSSGEVTRIVSLRQRGIYRMELIQAAQDFIVFQARTDNLFILNLESLVITKFFPTHLPQTLLPSVISNSLLIIKGDSLYVLQLQPQYQEIKVSFTSEQLFNAQPICISGNLSGPYLAVAFESGQIALVNQFTLKEECIICDKEDMGGSVQKMLFSQGSGQFLFVLDSTSSLYKFKIFQNLRRTSNENIQRLQLDLTDQSFQNNSQDSKLQEIKEEKEQFMASDAGPSFQAYRQINVAFFKKVFQDRNLYFQVDFRGKIKVIQKNTNKFLTQISDHLLCFKTLRIQSILFWSQLQIFLIIFKETILFIQPYSLQTLGYLVFKNPGDILKNAKTHGLFLILQMVNNDCILIEFVNQQLPIKASRCFPCIFNLFLPANSQLIMQCSGLRESIPFFPRVHLNHAFQEVYDPYSPILFWYKVVNYNGIRSKTFSYFRGHEHILFRQRRLTLLHFYTYDSNSELLKQALDHGAPLLHDTWKQTPLSIAVNRKSISCIQVLLQYFSCPRVNSLFSDSLIIQHNLIQIANLPNSRVPEVFVNLEIDPSKDYELPNFVNFQDQKQVFIPLKEHIPNDLVPLYLNLEEQKNLCSYSLTTVEFDTTFGSHYNIKFINALVRSPHLAIFNAPPIQSYIRYHWKTARKFFIVEAVNFFIYAFMISAHAIRIRRQDWLVFVILGLSILQAAQELWQIVGKGRDYFKNTWNVFDFSGIILLWIYIALYFFQNSMEIKLWFLALSSFQIFSKLFSYVRFWSQSRFLIRIISNICLDIRPFLSFMVLYTIAFTVVFLAATQAQFLVFGENHFVYRLYNTYRFDLGKSDPAYLTESTLMKILYIPSTILVTIILFNLLIALIRDSFLKTKQNREANDYLEIAHMIADYMTMAMWNYKKQSSFHIFHCQNAEATTGISGLAITQSNKARNVNYVKKDKKQEQSTSGISQTVILKRLDQICARINKLQEKLNSDVKIGDKNQIMPGDYLKTSQERKSEFGSEKLIRKTFGLKRSVVRTSNAMSGGAGSQK